jgi:hypothetical protein
VYGYAGAVRTFRKVREGRGARQLNQGLRSLFESWLNAALKRRSSTHISMGGNSCLDLAFTPR